MAHGAAAGGVDREHRWSTPATALLETLVHAESASLLEVPYVLLKITLEEREHLLHLPSEALPCGWQAWLGATQEIGTFRFERRASVALEVPASVVPYHRNYLANLQHLDFEKRMMWLKSASAWKRIFMAARPATVAVLLPFHTRRPGRGGPLALLLGSPRPPRCRHLFYADVPGST